MAASDLTSIAFIVKRDYSGRQSEDVAKRDHLLFSKIARNGGFVGDYHFYKIKYGNPQGISGALSSAQTAASSSKGKQLQMSRKAKFGVITLNGEAMAATGSDKGAFANIVYMETDSVLEEMGDSFAFDLYRGGYGTRGKCSVLTSNTVQLDTIDDARNFKVGMTVVASNADITGASLRSGSTTVAAVDEDAGTIELTSAAALVSFQAGDYLFRLGDPSTCMEGLAALTPLSAPTSGDSFRGISRFADPRRLAGCRIDDTGTYMEQNIGKLAVRISQLGKKATDAYANPVNVYNATQRLGAKVEFADGGGGANYGFQYITIHTPAGALRLWPDADCPTNRAYVCNESKHYLKHLKELPHIIMDDDLRSLRAASADDIEMRARGWVNYAQDDPGCFGVCSV
jgi:hypothetical protein